MRIEHLEYMICLARTHSITKASEELFTTHQNVSKMIRQLEQELGVSLFTRSQKGVYLTAEGEVILEFAQNTVDQLRKARERLYSLQARQTVSGDLYIYSGMTAASAAFSEVLQLFTASYPNIGLHLCEAEPLEALQQAALHEQSLALAPIMDYPDFRFVYEPYLDQLQCLPLNGDRFCCIIGRSSPLARSKFVSLSQFVQYPLALTQVDHFLKHILALYGPFTVGFSSNNPTLYLQALSSGRYIGLTTEAIHQRQDIRNPAYQHITILPFAENLGFHNCLLARKQTTVYPPRQAFIEHIRQHLPLLQN